MQPYLPHVKLFVESVEACLLTVYLLAGLRKPKHVTYWLMLVGWGALAYDLVILHTHHSRPMWGALNLPLIIWLAYFSYVKILRKLVPRAAHRLAAVCTMLFRG